MKKLLIAVTIAAATVSISANAFWDDGNSNTNWNGYGNNNWNNNAYGSGYGNGWGDGSGDADMDGDIEITIKSSARGRGRGNTRGSASGSGRGSGYNNWDNRFQGAGDNRYYNDNRGYGYSPYGYGRPPMHNMPYGQPPKAAPVAK